MSSRHVVRRGGEIDLAAPAGSNATGLRRWSIVDEDTPGAVHTGFAIVELAAGGRIPWHVHSYEDSLYVLEGEVVVDTGEGANLLRAGDYGVSAVGAPHALRNVSDSPVRWAQMLAPQPRARVQGDTYPVPALPEREPRPSTSATRGPGRSATSTRGTWRSASRRRTCSPSRPACAPRSSSTAGSR